MNENLNLQISNFLVAFHRALLVKKKAAAKNFELTLGQAEVLVILCLKDQKTVPQIARSLGVSRQNTQIIVNALNRRGLILPHPNPDHRLSPLFSLTAKGVGVVSAIQDFEKKITDNLFEGISIGEKTVLLKTLKNLTLQLY